VKVNLTLSDVLSIIWILYSNLFTIIKI